MSPQDKARLEELKPTIYSRVPKENIDEYRALLRKYIDSLKAK